MIDAHYNSSATVSTADPPKRPLPEAMEQLRITAATWGEVGHVALAFIVDIRAGWLGQFLTRPTLFPPTP
jgi:hypothetical protein